MESFNSAFQPRILFAVLVVGLLFRVVFVLTNQTFPISDESEYDQLAQTIVSKGAYAVDGRPTAYRPPGYPAFLAWSYVLFGHNTIAPKIVQTVLDTLTAYLLFCIGRLRSERTGLIAALVWSVFVPAVFYANLLLAESLTAFLLVATAFVFLRIEVRHGIPRLIGFGFLMGLVVLVKPGLLLLPLVLFLFSTWMSIRLRHAIFILVGAAFAVLPWMIRNQLVLSTFSLSTNTGMNLYIGNNPAASGAYRGEFPDILADLSLTEVTRNKRAMSEAKEYILSNPGTFLLNGAKKLVNLFRSEGDVLIGTFSRYSSPVEIGFKERYRSAPIPLTILTNIVAFAVLVGGIVGFSMSVRNRQFWFALSVLLTLLITHFVFFGGSRFHFILMPFAALYSSEALDSRLRKELNPTGRQKLIIGVSAIALAAIWSYEFFVVFNTN